MNDRQRDNTKIHIVGNLTKLRSIDGGMGRAYAAIKKWDELSRSDEYPDFPHRKDIRIKALMDGVDPKKWEDVDVPPDPEANARRRLADAVDKLWLDDKTRIREEQLRYIDPRQEAAGTDKRKVLETTAHYLTGSMEAIDPSLKEDPGVIERHRPPEIIDAEPGRVV